MFDFNDVPQKPPRSLALLPGLKYSSSFDKGTLFSLVALVLVVCFLPVIMLSTMERSFRLPFVHMETVEGSVSEVINHSNCDRRSITLHYQFLTKQDRVYYGKYVSCQGSMYTALNVGDSLPIVYDPKDPSYNGVEGELGNNDPPFHIFLMLPIVFLFLFGSMLMPNIKEKRNARSIFQKGFITQGKIIFVGRKKAMSALHFKGLFNLEVSYCFDTMDGKTIEVKVPTDNDWLVNKLDIGSDITVAYIEEKPAKSIVLDFYYR